MKRLMNLAVVAIALMIGLTSTTHAQTLEQPAIGALDRYFNIYGGYGALHDYQGEQFPITQTGTFNGGFILGTAMGRRIGQNRRVEMDSAFRYNSGDTWTGAGTAPFDGRVRNFSTMFNLIQDFGQGAIRPYIGGGVGVAYTDGLFDVSGTTFDITDAAFAYQGIAGISSQMQNGMEFFSEYRFYANTDVNLTNVPAATSTNFTYLTHDVIIGIRIAR